MGVLQLKINVEGDRKMGRLNVINKEQFHVLYVGCVLRGFVVALDELQCIMIYLQSMHKQRDIDINVMDALS